MNPKASRCQQPEQLKGRPQDCTPEQIRQCHGEDAGHPCVTDQDCEQPQNLQGRPQDCTPEQIRQCHGEDAGHPCSDK